MGVLGRIRRILGKQKQISGQGSAANLTAAVVTIQLRRHREEHRELRKNARKGIGRERN
jgi:hypothetical protein